MTLEELIAKVGLWDSQHTGAAQATSEYSFILNQLTYYARKEWKVYLPAEHPDFNANYLERLAAWIGNLTDEADQKLLLKYASHISFFSHDDFAALYRCAMDREITRWLADKIGASLYPDGPQAFDNLIKQQVHQSTWFCPITDSMDINEFYKTNHIKGIAHRPAFATIQMLAEMPGSPNPGLSASINNYMANPSLDPNSHLPRLERLVLLEDIVGSGQQCLRAIQWAVKNVRTPILFVPLILCPNGVGALDQEARNSGGKLTVRPIIELQREDLLGPERQSRQGWTISNEVEELAVRCSSRVSGAPFGYKDTGCSIVTFANTPDNTLPMVHNKSVGGNWEPIFPRVYRD